MSAFETAMLIHLALLAEDLGLAHQAYSDYICGAESVGCWLDRVRRLNAILAEAGMDYPERRP